MRPQKARLVFAEELICPFQLIGSRWITAGEEAVIFSLKIEDIRDFVLVDVSGSGGAAHISQRKRRTCSSGLTGSVDSWQLVIENLHRQGVK